MPARQ